MYITIGMKSKSLLDFSNDLGYFRLSLSNIKNQTAQKIFAIARVYFLSLETISDLLRPGCLILKNDMNISLILRPKLKKKRKTD